MYQIFLQAVAPQKTSRITAENTSPAGKNIRQAKTAIDAALRRSAGLYRIVLIHGFHAGTTLKEMILHEYASHPLLLRIETGMNRGQTDLVLREL